MRGHIPFNLRRLRAVQGFSEGDLATRTEMSVTAYQRIERGEDEPSAEHLQAIADALKTPIHRLVTPIKKLSSARFRSGELVLELRESILDDVARWIDNFCDIENIVDNHIALKINFSRVRKEAARNKDKCRCRTAAMLVRKELGLGESEPLHNISGLLESAGIKIGERKFNVDNVFGLSVAAREGGPAIVVNTREGITVERQIFTAAHELGHLVLHPSDYDGQQSEENEEHEREADIFAAAFLIPAEAFWKEWNSNSGLSLSDCVMRVKSIFRVSYKTVLHELSEKIDNVREVFARDYEHLYGHTLGKTDEPAALSASAFRDNQLDDLKQTDFTPSRLPSLVREAVEHEEITLSRAAEILEISLLTMHDLATSWGKAPRR